MPRKLRTTAAWRISLWAAGAFGVGTAIAFFIVYLVVAGGIRARSDAWLSGEAEVLADVAMNTPRDNLYDRVMEEVAELAAHEVPDERNSKGQSLNSVFFLQTDPSSVNPLWVGPGSDEPFVRAIQNARLAPGVPQSIRVQGWKTSFRVVAQVHENGSTVYLGLSDRGAKRLLSRLIRNLLVVWSGMLVLGFLISYLSAKRTLSRVERITETAARIGSEDLGERLPEPANSDEISRLGETFNNMLDRIQASVNQLRAVTDGVAHDLKSPVTSIRGTLESALCSDDDEGWRDSVAEAIESLDRLLSLLNTTLDLAEAQAGALHLDRSSVDLNEAITKLVALYQPVMAEKQHKVFLDLDRFVPVEADACLLNRVLSNLLENELIHLPPARQIFVRLRSHSGYAEIVIEDNGPGFPPDIGTRAFERFVKGKHSPGHGLGLAFVDAVVQAHGGTVRISERPGGGAVVTLSLPVGVLEPA